MTRGISESEKKSIIDLNKNELFCWYLLTQGATWDLDSWYHLVHRLQVNPVTPSLHVHCPNVLLQDFPDDPMGWQSHAENTSENKN
jgi:hypothetical protein